MYNKKKFDRVNGEIRHCKMCDKDFHTMKPTWHCNKCLAKKIYDAAVKKHGEGIIPTGKFAGQPKKKPYPFNTRTFENRDRFSRIKKELNQCKTKEERRQYYAKQLEEIKTNGIWEWIFDRRNDEAIKEGRNKSNSLTRRDYPDTRGHYEY